MLFSIFFIWIFTQTFLFQFPIFNVVFNYYIVIFSALPYKGTFDNIVVKKKTFELEPISVEDAKVFLDTIDNNFYVFLNRETGRVNVLYKRLDNNFGLIEAIY